MLSEATLSLESPAERAEARGLADLTLRRMGEIDVLLGRHVERMPMPPGLHILRLMVAELVFAGTAAHAGVDLAVHLAKTKPGARRLAGLINAVGRRVASDLPTEDLLASDPMLNLTGWLKNRLIADWGEEAAIAIARAHLHPAPHDLTLAAPANTVPLARELDAEPLPTGSLRLRNRPQLTTLPGFATGAWWAQDAAAALPARLLRHVAGARVLDLCAAPGGKTMQLAAAGAHVTALDISARRMARLEENLLRTGLVAEKVVANALEWTPDAPFDAILLDAPCSATGTIRRHPDLPLRKGAEDLGKLIRLQARLLKRAFGWLVPGGVIVFATCSLARAEGEDRIDAFLAQTASADLIPITPGECAIPAEFIDAKGFLRTRPEMWAGRGGIDGFFAARVRRRA